MFDPRTSTGSGLFALLSRDLEKNFGQIVSLRVKTLSNTNLVAFRHIKGQKGSLPNELKLPNDDMKPSKRQVSIISLTFALKYVFLSEPK